MLNKRSAVRFPAVFLLALAVLLALALEWLTPRSPFDPRSFFSRFQPPLVASVYFLIISGYLVAFLACYLAATRKAGFKQSLLIHSALFILCYALFFGFMAEAFSTLDALLLGAGILSVVVSQALAESLERCRHARHWIGR